MKSKGINAFQLKLFMAFLMVFDHISQIPGLVPDGWDGVLHALTRCVGVAFAFMAVEGFLHTRNRLAYNMRLFFWAALMQTGNCILTLLFQEKGIYLTHNIFLTLACGVLMLSLFFGFSENGGAAKDRKHGLRIAAGVLVLLAGLVFSEGGMALLPFMLLTYLFRNQVFFRNLTYVVWAGSSLCHEYSNFIQLCRTRYRCCSIIQTGSLSVFFPSCTSIMVSEDPAASGANISSIFSIQLTFG